MMGIKTAKERLFVFILVVLALPLLQNTLGFVSDSKLNGAVTNVEDTSFSWGGWFSGRFQDKKTAHLNDSFGFRPSLVRFTNQMDFSLFGKLHANSIVAGSDDYLYEQGYIDAYCGSNYPGDSLIRSRVVKLKKLQDTLLKTGTRLILLCAPSKARYYKDHFPTYLQCAEGQPNMYQTHKRLADSAHLEQIDINGWFADMRNKTEHLLFSKYGIHWTHYGALLASDSLIKYIEQVDNIDLPDLVWDKMNYSSEPNVQEHDISEGLNLLFPFKKEKLTHPDYHFVKDSTKAMPRMIFLGDSFLWTLRYINLFSNISSDWEMWFYFYERWGQKPGNDEVYGPEYRMKEYDWLSAVQHSKYMILVYTETNIKTLGDGFIEQAYEYYYGARQLY